MKEKVGAVIVTNVGTSDRLDRCVEALLAGDDVAAAVVVDNSGSPPPVLADERIHVVSTDNRGYGAAVNEGVAVIEADAPDAETIAVLNDDVEVTNGWLEPLRRALITDDVGAVQPTLAIAGSSPPRVNSLGVQLDRFGAGSDIGDGTKLSDVATNGTEIPAFTGGAVLVRRSMFEQVGGFDERYFLYYEDVDLALRARERGWRFRHEPASIVWHEVGATTAALGDHRLAMQERNRLRIAFRFGDPVTVVRAIGLSVRRLRHHPRRTHARALVAGLATAPSAIRDRFRARRS
jgi:GT2 family glycosyltransferase